MHGSGVLTVVSVMMVLHDTTYQCEARTGPNTWLFKFDCLQGQSQPYFAACGLERQSPPTGPSIRKSLELGPHSETWCAAYMDRQYPCLAVSS